MDAKRKIYFAGAFLPNEGEPEQTLEMAVLEWQVGDAESMASAHGSFKTLPRVYMHSFVSPRYPARVRWGTAEENGLDSRKMRKHAGMFPSVDDLLSEDYLRGRDVVVFDDSKEPIHSMVAHASSVSSISQMWARTFSGEEQAREITRLPQMLEYLGYPSIQSQLQHTSHFTALLLELFAMAAVWSVLEELRLHVRKVKTVKGALPISQLWPVNEPSPEWFDGTRTTLASIPAREVDAFFSREMQDYIDWRRTCIYVNDWIFRRPRDNNNALRESDNRDRMIEHIFCNVLDLRMQLWTLVFYAVFEGKRDYARQVALQDGHLGLLPSSARSDFTSFMALHLQDLLDPQQKRDLLAEIIRHYLLWKSRQPFEAYDFAALSREQQRNPSDRRYFLREGPTGVRVKCFREIATSDKVVRYRCYEISGRGAERDTSVKWVNEMFRLFMEEIKDPFSHFWSVPATHRWIRCITGVSWDAISRQPRMNEPQAVRKVRSLVSQVISEQSLGYVKSLRRHLAADIARINSNPEGEFTDRFAFMGVSVEIVVVNRSQTPLLKRLFNFG
jgi:hypothetical protein